MVTSRSIGVGQYQHDVSQLALSRSLDAVIEDCVNAVGVDVNTASSALLSRISGLTSSTAELVVQYRNEHGLLKDRHALLSVPRIGAKTFEQAAGFLRVMGGDNPLDSSAVHPESYHVVDQIAVLAGKSVAKLVGDNVFVRSLKAEQFVTDTVGLPTIRDILAELEKPGRDPRPEFKTASFKEGVEKISDLTPDMVLEGVVTNVTNFGAFVDVGVHQDGLVHISCLANQFVKDPRDVVKAGDIVRVKVMEVDVHRKRIGLTMRLDDTAEGSARDRTNSARTRRPHPAENKSTDTRGANKDSVAGGKGRSQNNASVQSPSGTFAAAFAAAKDKRR